MSNFVGFPGLARSVPEVVVPEVAVPDSHLLKGSEERKKKEKEKEEKGGRGNALIQTLSTYDSPGCGLKGTLVENKKRDMDVKSMRSGGGWRYKRQE